MYFAVADRFARSSNILDDAFDALDATLLYMILKNNDKFV